MTKKVLTGLMYALTFLLLASIMGDFIVIYSMASKADTAVLTYVGCLFRILVCVFAIYYVVAGCKKDEGANYFKAFMNLYALAMLLEVINLQAYATLSVVLFTLSFGALTVLSTAENLGERMSMLLACVVTLCGVAQFITFLQLETVGTALWIAMGTYLLLALQCILMVYAKYQDKKQRGSK